MTPKSASRMKLLVGRRVEKIVEGWSRVVLYCIVEKEKPSGSRRT